MDNKTPPPKLTFPDITELKTEGEKTVVRVNQEAHDIVSDIAKSTGLPMSKVATEMILFAARYFNIGDKIEAN